MPMIVSSAGVLAGTERLVDVGLGLVRLVAVVLDLEVQRAGRRRRPRLVDVVEVALDAVGDEAEPGERAGLGHAREERDLGVGDALHRVPVLGAVGRVEHEVVGARVDAVDQPEPGRVDGAVAAGRPVRAFGRLVRRRPSVASAVVPPSPSVAVGPRRRSSPLRRRRSAAGAAARRVGVVVVVVAARCEHAAPRRQARATGFRQFRLFMCSPWVWSRGHAPANWCVRQVDRTLASGTSAASLDLDRAARCRRSTSASHDGLRDDLDEPGAQLAHAGDEAAGQQEHEEQQAEAEEHAGDGVAALAVLEPVEQRLGDLLRARAACPTGRASTAPTK